MKKRTVRRGVFFLAALGAAAAFGLNGCAPSEDDEVGEDASEIRELERRAVGKAVDYTADTFTEADEERFATSKKARRELGWKVLAKALQPVPIAAQPDLPRERYANGRLKPKPKLGPTIPLFRTWLGGDEFDRVFTKMYGDLGKEKRLAQTIPTANEIQAAFDWNVTSLGPNSEAEFYERIKQIQGNSGVQGLGGNGRVAYSPAYVRHYLEQYPTIAGCDGKLENLEVDTMPVDEEKNFTNCFASEFPTNAAVIKASWRRGGEMGNGIPVLDTSPAKLEKLMKGEADNGGWNLKNLPMEKPDGTKAYNVKLSDETEWSLSALHVMTKELRHWVWVTVWWSDKPDEDFGADRPAAIKRLGGPWSNYKMCVVTDFEEKDPDPRGGFEGSLGDALAAVHGKNTWCSNGFIEKGEHNAQTNCIGCHQHAGDTRSLDKVLTEFDDHGRSKLRKGFPADYSWAFATPASPDQKDRLLDVVLGRMRSYAADDQQ